MRILDWRGKTLFTKKNPGVVTIAEMGDDLNNAVLTKESAYRFLEKTADGRDGIGSFMLEAGVQYEFPVNGQAVNFRNMGTGNLFYGPLPNKMDDNWPVMAGGRSGPITTDDRFYFYSETEARVYYAFMEV